MGHSAHQVAGAALSKYSLKHYRDGLGRIVLEDESKRLELLKRARRESGVSLDFWDELTRDLGQSSLENLVGKSWLFPKYIKSKGTK